MSVDIVVPTLGESVTEATIARWLKQPGEAVAADEPLVELETDKVTVEIPSPQAGVLADLQFGEGDNVEVGALLARIMEGNGAAAAPAPAPKAAAPAAAPAPMPAAPAGDALASAGPAAKKAAADLGISAATIQPTGRDGRATKADVHAAASAPAPIAPAAAPAAAPAVEAPAAGGNRSEERVRMSRLRKTIAARLKNAQNTAAMLTTFNEVDMTEVLAIRKEFQEGFEKRHGEEALAAHTRAEPSLGGAGLLVTRRRARAKCAGTQPNIYINSAISGLF